MNALGSETSAGCGVNIIGHVSANLGLGVVARNLVRLALSRGRDVAVYDVDAGGGRSGADLSYASLARRSLSDLPHAINIFVISLGDLNGILNQLPPSHLDGSHLNAIVCFWELPTIPDWGVAALEKVDVVLAATNFMEATYRQYCTRSLVVPARIPVTPPDQTVLWDRAAHHIPRDAVTFVCGFEPKSDPNRKNPFGAIEAFLTGVGRDEDAYLIIRINNAINSQGELDGVVQKVLQAAKSHPRIRVLTDPMSYPEIVGVYQDSDVYVSLHRAEGLGLGMAEAMLMSRVVMATGWSGNMSFMNHASACLVGFRLIDVESTITTYRGKGNAAFWADPRIDEAAVIMQLLKSDRGLRQYLGEQAKITMDRFNADAQRAFFLDELDSILELRAGLTRLGHSPRHSIPSYTTGRIASPSAFRRLWWRLQRSMR